LETFDLEAELVANDPLGQSLYRLRWLAPEIALRAVPGQFVMLGPLEEQTDDPFLNRPFSIHRTHLDGRLDLLVGVVGRGTQMMAAWSKGKKCHLLGPLGNGFQIPVHTQEVLLVGGGMGIAPLVFLAQNIPLSVGDTGDGLACTLLYGAASKKALVASADLNLTCRIEWASDDGSCGHHGFVSDLLEQRLESIPAGLRKAVYVASCGPRPMLGKVQELCRKFGVAAEAALENHMACGVGTCMGCIELVAGQHKRVCVDGPVFPLGEVFS
jgi:dihydroorotate dehydrogenase electron transfer subunit